jgi:uncharacterized protein (DUF736 family)
MPEPIKDGVYAQVAGTVGQTFDGRFTIEVMLNEKNKYPDRVTVWKPDFAVTKGDRVSVKGWFSWRKNEKDGKTYVDTSINEPKLVAQESGTSSTTADEEMPF